MLPLESDAPLHTCQSGSGVLYCFFFHELVYKVPAGQLIRLSGDASIWRRGTRNPANGSVSHHLFIQVLGVCLCTY